MTILTSYNTVQTERDKEEDGVTKRQSKTTPMMHATKDQTVNLSPQSLEAHIRSQFAVCSTKHSGAAADAHLSTNQSSLHSITKQISTQLSLYQMRNNGISLTWIILDSALSIDMFVNDALLTDIQTSERPISIMSNTGQVNLDKYG